MLLEGILAVRRRRILLADRVPVAGLLEGNLVAGFDPEFFPDGFRDGDLALGGDAGHLGIDYAVLREKYYQ
jgi:hypothetical protein